MGIVYLILISVLGISLLSLIYFGVKYVINDGISGKGLKISSILVILSSIFLLLLFHLFH